MFRPKVDTIPEIELYPKLERELGTVKKEGVNIVGGFTLRKNKDIIFQPGFQEAIQTCEADVIWTGGTASAGKTYGLLMEAMRGIEHYGYSGLIIKKELVEVNTAGGILSDAKRIYKDMPGCEFSASEYAFRWPCWQSSIMLTHINLQGVAQEKEAQEKMKNKQASYIAIDELTNFTFKVFVYWFSRNRDASGMRPKMICSMNANGWHWTKTMLTMAGYIGPDNYVIPEMVGVLKYFVIQGNKVEDIVWGSSKAEIINKIPELHKQLTPEMIRDGLSVESLIKSFTFIPGNIMDNRIMTYQTQGGNVANLFNLGEGERLKLLYGYWGEMEEGEALVSASEITRMFPGDNQNAIYGDEQMYMTVDIGDGGDPTEAAIWKGLTCIALNNTYTSDSQEKVSWVRSLKSEYNIPIEHIAVDAGGIGNYFDSYMRGVVAIVSNKSPMPEYDETGNKIELERYVYLRDQLCGKLCAYISTGRIRFNMNGTERYVYGRKRETMEIADLINLQAIECLKRSENERGKYFFTSKKVFKNRHNYSPDKLDLIIYRMIFELDATLKKEPDPVYTMNDYYAAMNGTTEGGTGW